MGALTLLLVPCAALAAALQPVLPPALADASPLLRVGVEAAGAAGAHMLGRLGAAEVLSTKADRADLVTAVDGECQQIIAERIAALRGDGATHLLLGEEDVAPGVTAAMAALREKLADGGGGGGGERWLWVVDPVDGTTNFVAGMPLCAVSIGIVAVPSGERMGAVVLDPFRGELFAAWRGRGAYLNDARMECSPVAELADAVVCGASPKLHAVPEALRGLAAVMPRCRSVRILGSGVLNFAWVACGRLGAYFEPELAPWDTAAGTLLIEEAGGTVSGLDGGAFDLETRAVLGSAAGIHTELLRLLRGPT